MSSRPSIDEPLAKRHKRQDEKSAPSSSSSSSFSSSSSSSSLSTSQPMIPCAQSKELITQGQTLADHFLTNCQHKLVTAMSLADPNWIPTRPVEFKLNVAILNQMLDFVLLGGYAGKYTYSDLVDRFRTKYATLSESNDLKTITCSIGHAARCFCAMAHGELITGNVPKEVALLGLLACEVDDNKLYGVTAESGKATATATASSQRKMETAAESTEEEEYAEYERTHKDLFAVPPMVQRMLHPTLLARFGYTYSFLAPHADIDTKIADSHRIRFVDWQKLHKDDVDERMAFDDILARVYAVCEGMGLVFPECDLPMSLDFYQRMYQEQFDEARSPCTCVHCKQAVPTVENELCRIAHVLVIERSL